MGIAVGIIVAVFIIGFLVMMYFFPAKTLEDLPLEAGEVVLFDQSKLKEAVRYHAAGRRQSYPGARLYISNKKVVIAQATLGSSKFTLREIMLNAQYPQQSLSDKKLWGNVLVSMLDYSNISLKENSDNVLVIRNPNAFNLDRYEIIGVENAQDALRKILGQSEE